MKLLHVFIFIILISVSFSTIAHGKVISEKNYTWSFNPDPQGNNHGERFSLTVKLTDGKSGSNISKSGNIWHIEMLIPEKNYTYYSDLPGAYRYAFNISYLQYFLTLKDENIRELAYSLNNIAKEEGYDNLTKLNFILSFVQETITYEDDFVKTGFYDYYQFPLETLVQGTGDCEDKSLLLATLAHDLGYDVVLIVMNITADMQTEGHVAVGAHFTTINYSNPLSTYLRDYYIYDGKIYYYMESTANQSFSAFHPAYYIGVSPEEGGYAISDVRILPYKNSWYSGYSPSGKYVKEIKTEESFPWYLIIMSVSLVIYIPLIVLAFLSEKKKCPSCHREIEEEWNYCPHCGYWLKYHLPPPPRFNDEQSIK